MVRKWGEMMFFVGFNDSMELGKTYGAQLGVIHVLGLSLMVLLKKNKKRDQLWVNLMSASKIYFLSLTRKAENVNDDIFCCC